MRLLHTSDWHLGQNFMGKSREGEHRAFIRWLLNQIELNCVDALIIAGDIFDTGAPPSYARKLYNDFIVSLKNTHCSNVVIVGGNHDSVAMLEESRELLAYLNITVVGGVKAQAAEQVVVLKKRNGQPGAVLCAIPFLRARDIMVSQAGESLQDKQSGLQTAIARHYAEIYAAACHVRENLSLSVLLPIIATGHLLTVGGSSSESVRDIYIGSLDAFPAQYFPPADYIALGHLHRSQKVNSAEHIRYSGSPIALSFDESKTTKNVLIVDFSEGVLKNIDSLPVPIFQPLSLLKGTLTDIAQQIESLSDPLDNSTLWIEIEVSEDDYLSDISGQIETMINNRPMEVLRIRRARLGRSETIERQAQETLSELKVEDVFARRLSHESIDDDVKQQLDLAYREIVSSIDDDTNEVELDADREVTA